MEQRPRVCHCLPQVLKMTEAAVQTFSTLGCSVEAASPNTISPEQAYSTYVSVRLGTALQSKMEETLTQNEFMDWIGQQYSLRGPEDIEVKSYSQFSSVDFSWQKDRYQHSTTLEDEKFAKLRISREGLGKLRARNIINCLGTPEFYYAVHGSAIHGENYQEFELFFPSAGVIAHGYRTYISKNYQTLPIEDNFPILYLLVLQPGTVEMV